VDNVVLLPIYPARELPIEGVSSNLVLDNVQAKTKALYTKEQLLDWVETDFAVNRNRELGEVIITAGAGDIDKLVEPIQQILTK
jgi:UDP-N-acetylmuramate--alanine ligase